MNCNNNQNNNNGCGCNCNPHPTPAPEPVDINMNVCDRNINMLPMLQTYTTKVLKPNIEGCCKKNILKQCMMNCENYKYVIKWDFDLNGQTITVPENCILEFDGGSLKNGTIIGQDTVFINVGDVDIWGEDLTRQGTWKEHSGGGGSIDVDDHLSDTSTNPVQNKVITEAFEAIVLPDKPYDPEDHSGLGRKTLLLKDGSNILTQEDFDQVNTIYVLEYDFELDGADIQMPEGCVLDFEGGSVSNGKLVSNSTIITGDYRGNALYGVYLNSLKEPMSYNYKQIKVIKSSVEHGYTPWLRDTHKKRITQSIAVFKYNGSKYIATFHIGEEGANANGGIYLFDEYYNFIKYVTLEDGQITHFNDVTVKGDDLLIAEGIYTSYGIRRISIPNLLSATDEGTVSSNKIDLCSDRIISCIDYDEVKHELAVYDAGNDTILIYNDNNELVSHLNNINTKLNTVTNKWTIQGFVYKNGQVLFMLWATQLDGYTGYASAIPTILDINTDSVYTIPYQNVPYSNAEIESICKDPDDESIYWTVYHLWLDGVSSTSRSAIVKHSFDSNFVGASNYIGESVGQTGDGTYMDVYVNERGSYVSELEGYTFNYIPNGSSKYPFKTLDSAIICAGIIGGRLRYMLYEGDYYLGKYNIANRFMHFIGQAGDRNKVRLHGAFSIWNSQVWFDIVSLINDYDNTTVLHVGDDASLITSSVNIYATEKRAGSSAIYIRNARAQMTNTSFDKFSTCLLMYSSIINNFNNISIKDCNYVFHVVGKSEVFEKNIVNGINFDSIDGEDRRKLVIISVDAVGPVFHIAANSTNYLNVFNFLKNRVYTADIGENCSTAVEVTITSNITSIYNKDTGEYLENEDRELETDEIRVNISRGKYYHNGYNLISVNGRNTIFSVDNPNYEDIPKSDMAVGSLFFDVDNDDPSLYKGIIPGVNSWLKLLTSMARSVDGGLNDCKQQGFYYFNPTGAVPDLGGSSQWYFVVNIGRYDICQIVTQLGGTKVGMRYRNDSNNTWTKWVIFEGVQLNSNQ